MVQLLGWECWPRLVNLKPDLVFLLGARTGMYLANQSGKVLPSSDCVYNQCDIDGGEIGRSHPIDLGITSDVLPLLVALNTAIAKDSFKVSQAWIDIMTSIKRTPSPFDKAPEVVNVRIHPYHALKAVASALEPGWVNLCRRWRRSEFMGKFKFVSCETVAYRWSYGVFGILGE